MTNWLQHLGRCSTGAARWWLLLAAVLAAFPVLAVRQFDTRDGLAQNSIVSIDRDDLGFLWFVSGGRLSRFDGRHFTAPAPAIAKALENVSITALASDGHVLWIGTRLNGVKRIDLRREAIAAIRPREDGVLTTAVRAIVIDAQHNAWVGTDGGGVVRITWHNGAADTTHFMPTPGGLAHERVWTMAIDGDAVIAGTQMGAARWTPGDDQFVAMSFASPFPDQGRTNIEEIASDGHGGYWIGTWDYGLFHSGPEGTRPIPVEGRGNVHRVTALTLVGGKPMVGFDIGIAGYQSDCDCLRMIPLAINSEGIAQRTFVRSLLTLEDGAVFVGSWNSGAFHVPPNATAFQRILPPHPADAELASERVQSVLEDRQGVVWIGSFGVGLQRSLAPVQAGPLKFQEFPIVSNSKPGARIVWLIYQDLLDRVWIGSDDGLDRFNPRDGSWTHFPVRVGVGLPGPGVRDLLELSSGEFLIGTSSGLALIDKADQVRTIRYAGPGPNEALGHTVNAMYRDDYSRLWLATEGGIYVLDRSYRRLHVFDQSALTRGVVRDLHAGPDGQLLLAASRLCILDARVQDLPSIKPECLGAAEGIPEDGLQAIETGIDGGIWISSMQGLRRLSPGQRQAQAFHDVDGLIAEEFGQHASYAGPSGRLYFGTALGLQVFDPREVTTPPTRLVPLVTEIRVGGRTLGAADMEVGGVLDASPPYASTLTLSAGSRQLMLGFNLLGANRKAQHVEFRIEGQQGWLPAADGASGNYLSLPAGDFELYLRANEDGVRIGEERLALKVRVLPLWWERPSVQIAGLLLLIAGVWMLYRSRVRALRERERRLTSEVKLRTREIEEQKSELALANQQLYELSIRDGLTGVFNRRHSLEEARRIIASNPPCSLCVALIDLDHFKVINDRFGHIAGDEVLRSFAKWLNAQSMPGDVFGRYGGEEFFCLLYDRDIAQAKHWADRLLARVRTSEVAGPNCEIHITASIGVVAIDPRAELPLEIWMARADAALYRAKESGRDSVLIG